MNVSTLLASISDAIPAECSPALAPFIGLLLAGLPAFFVEVFVRSREPRPSMPGRRILHRTVAALLCAPGALHVVFFILFAFRARALYGGWPPTFQFYNELQPWTDVFEWWQGTMECVGFSAGFLALPAAVPVFAGWRCPAFLAVFRALAVFAAACFLGLYLPLLLLPEAAVNWWYD